MGHVTLGDSTLADGSVDGDRWTVYRLPLSPSSMDGLEWDDDVASVTEGTDGPVFYHTEIVLTESQVTDSYVNTTGWGKGYVWVNGVNLGKRIDCRARVRVRCVTSCRVAHLGRAHFDFFVLASALHQGRYWEAKGPSHTLWLPSAYLNAGTNNVTILELEPNGAPRSQPTLTFADRADFSGAPAATSDHDGPFAGETLQVTLLKIL